jgi:hypothetical protein
MEMYGKHSVPGRLFIVEGIDGSGAHEHRKNKIVDGENEQRLGSALGDGQAAASRMEAPDSTAIRRALARLLRKRVKKFVALAPQVSPDANPKTVHNVRVWSRRLQLAQL